MKTGAVAIFVKTPGISPIKTRLAEALGPRAAETFHVLSAQAVEAVVKRAVQASRGALTPYWAVAEREGMENPLWSGFDRVAQGEGALGERLFRVYDGLLAKHSSVLLLGADCPQLSPEHIVQAGALVSKSDPFVVGPAADGGFYLFGGALPVSKEIWNSVPYSDPRTLKTLVARLAPLGAIRELPVLRDVDTKDDLVKVEESLREERAELLPEQEVLLSWITERARPSGARPLS